MLEINLKKLNKKANIPQKITNCSAGYDIYSCNEIPVNLAKGKVALIPTGIAISLPFGYEAQIRPRSGLALNKQIGILNSPGTIDADYRGEIKIILFNFGENDFVVLPNMRIAQMIINKVENVKFNLCENLDDTVRGEKGFGHSKY